MNLTIYGTPPSVFARALTEVRGVLRVEAGPQVVASCRGRAADSFYMVTCRGAVLTNGEWNVLRGNFCVSPDAASLFGPSALSDICTAVVMATTGDFILSLRNPSTTASPYMIHLEVLPVQGPAPVVTTP